MKKFNPLNASSKFAICGLPLRVDTYRYCTFGCEYCFSNGRTILGAVDDLQIGNISALTKRLHKVYDLNKGFEGSFIDELLRERITWHCGGMSDPFQPAEKKLHITKQMVDVSNRYGNTILFSTKSDTTYDVDIKPELHSFQLSVTNVGNNINIEPFVPSIERRLAFYRSLKERGFKVGIRIQPFIPKITTTEILDMFYDADHFTIEGLKLVPQNEEQKKFILGLLDLDKSDFVQMGLLNLKPEIRLELYKPFLKWFEEHGAQYSIADNDLHHMSTSKCCCGDALVPNPTKFNNTSLIQEYGMNYTLENIFENLNGCADCKVGRLFASNRQEGCSTMKEFFEKRFYRSTSPFSPDFLYKGEEDEG